MDGPLKGPNDAGAARTAPGGVPLADLLDMRVAAKIRAARSRSEAAYMTDGDGIRVSGKGYGSPVSMRPSGTRWRSTGTATGSRTASA